MRPAAPSLNPSNPLHRLPCTGRCFIGIGMPGSRAATIGMRAPSEVPGA